MELLTGRDAFPKEYDPDYYHEPIILRDFNTPIGLLPIDNEGMSSSHIIRRSRTLGANTNISKGKTGFTVC